jgi:putative membrane protein
MSARRFPVSNLCALHCGGIRLLPLGEEMQRAVLGGREFNNRLSLVYRRFRFTGDHHSDIETDGTAERRGIAMTLRTMVDGLCMALADSVPGVSGGTIAFIMGFYEKLLDSVHGLFRGKGAERRESAIWLVKLMCGWVVGMAFSMSVLSRVLESGIYALSSAFLGLTIAAIPLIVLEERQSMRGRYQMLVFTVFGAALVVAISLLRQLAGGLSLDFAALEPAQYLYVFVAGMVAVSAMILPGISGSTLLLIFGVYAPMVLAIHELMSLHVAVIPGLLALVAGIICGLALAIGGVRSLLKNHRPAMMYLIVGLMIGSLFAIVMGPTTMSTPQPALSLGTFNPIAFVVGAALVVGLEALKRRRGGDGGTTRVKEGSDGQIAAE